MAKIHDPETDKQIHNGRRGKLRESYLKYGLVSFNETQVLEFALGMTIKRVDTNPTAHRLMARFGSLDGVIDAHPDKLKEVPGIGEESAFFLNFLKQFITYYEKSVRRNTKKIKSPADAVNYLSGVMKTYSTEQFVLICIGKDGGIILEDTTTTGDLDKVEINLRAITDIVLRVKTASVIIAHNHLDSNTTPSDADIKLTRCLINILTPLSINVMDHIIFGKEESNYSFYSTGILDVFKREHKNYIGSRDYEDYMYMPSSRERP